MYFFRYFLDSTPKNFITTCLTCFVLLLLPELIQFLYLLYKILFIEARCIQWPEKRTYITRISKFPFQNVKSFQLPKHNEHILNRAKAYNIDLRDEATKKHERCLISSTSQSASATFTAKYPSSFFVQPSYSRHFQPLYHFLWPIS